MFHHDFDLLYSGILRALRQTLRHCPEAAGSEAATARVIKSFLGSYHPDELLTDVGGHGVAAVYEGAQPGPTILVRCELDALETEAETAPGHVNSGDAWETHVAHLCGHDGHMTMVAGLAPLLQIRRLDRGRVVLLFQPAEETGEGAQRVIADPKFERIRPDYALALHNLPGEPANRVVVRPDTFACASVGMRVTFEGLSSHAAEPELARTPAPALCALLSELPALSTEGDSYRLLTVTHVHMGRPSFGITPGHAELNATLRAVRDEVLMELRDDALRHVHAAAESAGVSATIEWSDEFPATMNDRSLVDVLESVCDAERIERRRAEVAFRWSEDFGHFGRICPSICFGLGIGEDRPPLHHPDYAFEDSVITTGVMIWSGLISALGRIEASG
jgi:amidohydrolase